MAESGDAMTGTVDWYNSERNFGFIDGNDGESYFVHLNEILSWPKNRGYKHLRSGDRVSFQAGPARKEKDRPQALGVVVVEE